MVRKYSEYDENESNDIEEVAKAPKETKTAATPILHIVDTLPTKELRQFEKDGQVHNFITTQEAVQELWNRVMSSEERKL